MDAPKLFANYKCECYGADYCTCRPKDDVHTTFADNVSDVADVIAEVMVICGIHPCKARASTEVVRHAFEHYDEVRHRVDAAPSKRLCREDFIHDLGMKCLMTRMEAQLSYSIAKRAFKAFYHGTCAGGIHNPLLEAQLIHSQECMWVHAARRTAQIFAAYEGMFLSAQRNYEALIRCAYKRLYERLLARNQLLAESKQLQGDCECRGCLKKSITFSKETMRRPESMFSTKTATAEQQILSAISCSTPLGCELVAPNEMAEHHAQMHAQARLAKQQPWHQHPHSHPGESAVPFCQPCKCPRLICDCNAVPGTPSLECSQGPYVCRWLPVTAADEDEEQRPDPCTAAFKMHECPVDCADTDDENCDAECVCDCDGSCECAVEDMSSDYEDGGEEMSHLGLHTEMAEEHELDMSEGPTYAGCCVMLNHIAEEMQMADHSLSVAHIEGRRNESSTRFEQQVTLSVQKPSTTTIIVHPKQSNTSNAPHAHTKALSEAEQKMEAEEISKLLASMI